MSSGGGTGFLGHDATTQTSYEIHGWNNSGANTKCALVEECLVLHCKPCITIHILGSGPFNVCCLDSQLGFPVKEVPLAVIMLLPHHQC